MDPNETLRRIRELTDPVRGTELDGSDVQELVDLINGLDRWLTNKGFPPDEWSPTTAALHRCPYGRARCRPSRLCSACTDS